MEFFTDRAHVRLRCQEADVAFYLYADEDGWGVSMRTHRASLNTAWAVHLVENTDDDPVAPATYVLLHSAAYGRYLGTRIDYDDEDAPPQAQVRPDAVVQCLYDTPLQTNVLWEALTTENGGVVLRQRKQGHPEALQVQYIMLDCTVEAIAPRPAPPQHPHQIPNGVAAPVLPSRMIRYIRADNYGIFILTSRGTLHFRGRSLLYLIDDLAYKLNDTRDNIRLCVRAGFLGRITPLVVDLPLSDEIMDIVVLTTGSAVEMELRHPDVDAA